MANADRKSGEVLQKYGISLPEYYVMCVVHDRILDPPDELARTSAGLSTGDPRGEFPVTEHLKAVDSCLGKGYLKVLTAEDCEQEHKRQQSSQVPEPDDAAFDPGLVDFTQEGYDLFNQVLLEIFGEEHVAANHFGMNVDLERKEVHFYDVSRESCLDRLNDFKDAPSDWINNSLEVTDVRGPEIIGPWRANRFVLLPEGFHAVAAFEIVTVLEEQLLAQLEPKLHQRGFQFDREYSFRRESAKGKDFLYVHFSTDRHDRQVFVHCSVRVDALEDLKNEVLQLSHKRGPDAVSISASMEELSQGQLIRWTLRSENDAPGVSASILQAFETFAVRFYERFASLEEILSTCSEDDSRESQMYCSIESSRAMNAVGAAFLLGRRKEFEQLVKYKTEYLTERHDSRLSLFLELVQMLSGRWG